jgi:hypothetical protein
MLSLSKPNYLVMVLNTVVYESWAIEHSRAGGNFIHKRNKHTLTQLLNHQDCTLQGNTNTLFTHI